MEKNFILIKGEIIKIVTRKKDKKIIKCNIRVPESETKFSIFRVNFIGELAEEFYNNYKIDDEIFIEGNLRSSRFNLNGETIYSVEIQAKKIIQWKI